MRKTDDEILVVCHAFENPGDKIEIDLDNRFKICDTFNARCIEVLDNKLIINKMESFTAEAILLKLI